jgi:aldehyde dehydrogenase (NAD+)
MSYINEIVEKQKKFATEGHAKNISFRKKQLQLLKKILKENENYFYQEIFADIKKSKFETYLTELSIVYHEIDYALKNLEKWTRPIRAKTDISNLPAKSFIIPEPLGTTLIIGAWNYPYQLVLAPAVAALAAGNTAILKPSELPSRTSEALKKVINENFDPSYLHVIEGGVDVTTELLSYPYGKICFTGSTPVGKIIAKAAAETLTPTLLELGGKSPCIVMPDVDMKIAAKRIAWGKFLNAGQTCIAPDYLLIHSSIYAKFLDELKNQTALIAGENPLQSESYTRIINARNVQRLKALIDPQKVFSGGKIIEAENYIEPTILKNVSWDDNCMKEEIFGPIFPAISFDNIDSVIVKINEGSKPLALYIFSNDTKIQTKILNEISFGGGCINDVVMHFSNNYLPFGGVGSSGMGNYHGVHGFKTFSHHKSILKKILWFEPRVKYAPYTKIKFKILESILG